MKKVFIETQNVQRLRKVVGMAVDTEKGRPGMVAVWGEAGTARRSFSDALRRTGVLSAGDGRDHTVRFYARPLL